MRSIAVALLWTLVAASVGATVIVPADLGELTRDARAIARGRVVALEARWTDGRRTIETLVTLETETYLKGGLGETVQFRVPGGVLGRFRNIIVGAPQFVVGQRVIVFLGARGPSVPFVLGLNQGVYRLGQTPIGDWMVTPPPVAPGVAGPVTRGSQPRVPAPLADFEARVRALSQEAP